MRKKKVKFCGLTALGIRPGGPGEEPELVKLANCRNNHSKQIIKCMQQ